jgi:hypothetical protein
MLPKRGLPLLFDEWRVDRSLGAAGVKLKFGQPTVKAPYPRVCAVRVVPSLKLLPPKALSKGDCTGSPDKLSRGAAVWGWAGSAWIYGSTGSIALKGVLNR